MRILIVDDSSTMRKIVTRNLRQAGVDTTELTEASDGAEAWKLLEDEKFDLVLSDVNMPNMTGLELLDKIRAEEGLKTLPVIMVTTESTPHSVQQFTEHGASGCIGKPFTADRMGAVVSAVLDEA
jgi:two-component system chemotaxis response regulator CheY